jgi:hypothetical protein
MRIEILSTSTILNLIFLSIKKRWFYEIDGARLFTFVFYESEFLAELMYSLFKLVHIVS